MRAKAEKFCHACTTLGRGHMCDDQSCRSFPNYDHSALQPIGQILVILCHCQHLQNCPAGLEKQSARKGPRTSLKEIHKSLRTF